MNAVLEKKQPPVLFRQSHVNTGQLTRTSILHIGNFLSAQGVSRQFVEELADRMQSHGWTVYRTSFVFFRLGRLLNMVFTILFERKKFRVAHVAVFSGRAFLWALASVSILRLLGKPFVLSLHGGNLPDFLRRWPGPVRWLVSSATAVTCPSRYLLERFKGIRPDIRLIPNPVELSGCEYRLRKQPEPSIVWLRAFHRVYNPSLVPKVLKVLLPEFPGLRVSMIGSDRGDGSLQETKSVAGELGVIGHIRFVDKVPKSDVPKWLNTGDILLNTPNIDNTPTSVIEAMACGLCVVSTNVGGLPYLLANEDDALLVPPDDPQQMACAIRRVLREPGLAARLSRNGRTKVEQFDWPIIFPQWEFLFKLCAQAESAS